MRQKGRSSAQARPYEKMLELAVECKRLFCQDKHRIKREEERIQGALKNEG